MPLYEYQCDACGRRFETIQKFSDAPVEKCPTCGGTVHKLQSAPAFHLKGSGWYATDYAKKEQPGAAKQEDGKGEGGKPESGSKDAPGGEAAPKSDKADAGEKSAPAKDAASKSTPASTTASASPSSKSSTKDS